MSTNGLMTVGELSRRTGVPVKALREYTDWGLVSTPGRSPANYRLFDDVALECVRWIRTMRGLGLTLAEIRELASGIADASCESLGPRLAERLHLARTRLDDRIAELRRVRHRIDEFEATYRDTLSGRALPWTSV